MKVYVVLGYETCGATTRYEYLQQVRVAETKEKAHEIEAEMLTRTSAVEWCDIEEREVE